jgi:hypothetical protein
MLGSQDMVAALQFLIGAQSTSRQPASPASGASEAEGYSTRSATTGSMRLAYRAGK